MIPHPDPFGTEVFLDHLEPGGVFHFRTLCDKKINPRLNQKFSGTFEQCKRSLMEMNARGAGVFVVVNAGGQLDSEINALRAVFIDADGIHFRDQFPVTPSAIVQRDATHWHAYWFLEPDAPVASFNAAQKHLARFYGSDPAVSNSSRLMRLPGYWHRKADPVPVRLWSTSGRVYSLEELMNEHPVEPLPQTPARRAFSAPVTAGSFWRWASRAAESLAPGSRNSTAFRIAAKACARGVSPVEVEGFLLSFASPDFTRQEIAAVVRSAYSKPRSEVLA